MGAADQVPAARRHGRVGRGLATGQRYAACRHLAPRRGQARALQALVEQAHKGEPGREAQGEDPIFAGGMGLDHRLDGEPRALGHPRQLGPDAGVVPGGQLMQRPRRAALVRGELGQQLEQPAAHRLRVEAHRIEDHQQGGVGGHQVHQGVPEGVFALTAQGGEPGQVALLDGVEQPHHPAVEACGFQSW